MKKVAFLNLTYDSFNQDNLWKQFFDSGDPDSWNLYIHSKTSPPSIFSKYYIPNIVPTDWGHFSLVEATIEMMKEALKDEHNEYFSLISGAHIPLYSLDCMVGLIKNRYKTTTFSKHFSFSTKAASQRILKEGVLEKRFKEYYAVCQFSVWRRAEVLAFVETFEEYSKYFVKKHVIFADEFYFWAVARDLGLDYKIGQASTYSDWDHNVFDKNGQRERTPRVIKEVNHATLKALRGKGFIFARKILRDSLIKTNITQSEKNLDNELKALIIQE